MIKVQVSSRLIITICEQGARLEAGEVIDGIPEGCELVDVVFDIPGEIVSFYFDDGKPEETIKAIAVWKHAQ